MRIVRIIRKGQKAVIYFDDDSEMKVYPEVVYNNSLRKGDEITDVELRDIKDENDLLAAERSGLRMVARREHSEYELRKKLLAKGFKPENISKVIDKFFQSDYLNDERFGKKYIEELIYRRKIGGNKILLELDKRGLDKDLIRRLYDENFDEEINFKNAYELCEKKMRLISHKNFSDKQTREKLIAFLLARGFDFETVSGSVNKFINDRKA